MTAVINLLEETERILEIYDRGPQDVLWVGAEGYGWMSWREFEEIANIEYNASYGAPEIAMDLVVVGEDWWLKRCECDGSEWWELREKPSRPDDHKVPDMLKTELWMRLCEAGSG